MRLEALNQFSIIKQGDTKNEFKFRILDYDDLPVDLTGKTVKVVVANGIGKVLDKEPIIEDAVTGIISFKFHPKDVTGHGDMRLEVEVTDLNGETTIIPSDGYYKFIINRNLNDVSAGVTNYSLQYFKSRFDTKISELDTSMKTIESVTTEAKQAAEIANTKTVELENAIKQAIAAGTDDLEVKTARKNFTTLGERLDSTDAELASTLNYLSDFGVNVNAYGAIGDGLSHPLSEKYATLAEAQAVYPHATSLNDEIDWCGIVSAINKITENGGGTLYFPNKEYIVDFVIKSTVPITIRGNGLTKIKVKDQSKLFHNPTRNNTDSTKRDLNNLFRDYHAVFFFDDCDFTMEFIEIDGNGQNQTQTVGGEAWHYVTPTDGLTSDYKYFHGIQARYELNISPNITIRNCKIHHCSWNNIALGNYNTAKMNSSSVTIENNEIGEASHDGLSVHRLSNVNVSKNTFRNPNTHSCHIYFNVSDANVFDNEFILDDDLFTFKPNKPTDHKTFVFVGHVNYDGNFIDRVGIERNTMRNQSNTLLVNSVVAGKTVSDLSIENNKFYNVDVGAEFTFPILGDNSFKNNKVYYNRLGIAYRPFDGTSGSDSLRSVDPTVLRPYKSKWSIKGNRIIHTTGDTSKDSISLKLFGNSVSETELAEFLLVLRDNEVTKTAIETNKTFKVDDLIDKVIPVNYKTQLIDMYTIPAKSTRDYVFTSGAYVHGDNLIATPLQSLPAGLIYNCWINKTGEMTLRVYNTTDSSIAPGQITWVLKNIGELTV